MEFKHLEFVTFIIGCVAEKLNMPCATVYKLMKDNDIVNGYILPCYEALHSFSRDYATDDVIDFMRHKGLNHTM